MGIILTHAHLDHAGAVQPLLTQLKHNHHLSPLYYHSYETPLLKQLVRLLIIMA